MPGSQGFSRRLGSAGWAADLGPRACLPKADLFEALEQGVVELAYQRERPTAADGFGVDQAFEQALGRLEAGVVVQLKYSCSGSHAKLPFGRLDTKKPLG